MNKDDFRESILPNLDDYSFMDIQPAEEPVDPDNEPVVEDQIYKPEHDPDIGAY